ncbi:MAG TPA: TonB-dependent receptor [Gemmatimonadaceae bacterium]|nr:TonB-dependent receptor [Gemmatimonadaceae bacterium]
MRKLPVVLGLMLIGSVGSIQAQTPGAPPGVGAQPPALPPGEVTGTIVAEDNAAPVARAAIAVRNAKDSSMVTGTNGADDGTFRIQGLRPGTYFLRVSGIGFTPRNTEEFTIAPTSLVAGVGSIKLARFAVTLQTVEVAGQQAAVTIEPDRNTYQAKQVAPAATNASDVLAATPSVEVDADGKVSLRGNENVVVQINGRATPMRGQQLGAYLKQLPATIVERIEVVPNPSAKHDPEGMAGIVNVVLKQNVDLGLSGGLTLGMANTDRYNGSGNLGYQKGKVTLFGSYGYITDDRDLTGINDRERYDPSSVPLSFTDQIIVGRNGFGGHNLTTTVEYKFNQRDVLSNSFQANRRRFMDASQTGYTEFDGSRNPVDQYDWFRDTKQKALVLDNTLAFKRTFEPRKHEISTEFRVNRVDDDDNTTLFRQNDPGVTAVENQRDHVDAITTQLTAQLDYTRTLAPRTKLETGYKGTSRLLDRDFSVVKDMLGDGNWVSSPLSNSFDFEENVHAIYGVLSHGVGKFELQGGLRGERASRDFSLAQPAESYPYDYGSLFPSAVVMYKPSDASQIKASYSRRIRRPGTFELNPFPTFFDAQNVFIGNPQLNPEYTDAVELGLSRTGSLGSLQLSPFYRHTSNVIRVNIEPEAVVDGREVTTVTFQNLATADSWGSDLNGSLKLGPKFNGFASFNVFKMVTDGGSLSALSSDAVIWSYRVNGTMNMSPTVSLQAMYFYRAPVKVEQGEFSSVQMTNITLRKKLDGDKASVSVRFADPFNTNGFRVRAGDGNITQITARKFGVRATFFTFQYNFGQAPKLRPPTQDAAPPPAPVFN